MSKRSEAEERGYDPQDDTLPTTGLKPTAGPLDSVLERVIAAHRRTWAFNEGHEDAHRS